MQELADSLGEGDEIDVAICDISSIKEGSGILASVYNPGMRSEEHTSELQSH